MDASAIIWFLIVGAIIGWLAGIVVRGFGYGLVGNIVIGILGAIIGGWLLTSVLGVAIGTGSAIVNYIVTGLIGAVVLLAILGLFRSRPVY